MRNDWHPYRIIRWMYHILFRLGIVLHENKRYIEFEKIYRGSQWFIVPFEVIEQCIKYIDDTPSYLEYWKEALAPDEFLFQTLIMNSEYASKVQQPVIYINFEHTLMKHNHPTTITVNDFKTIEESGCFYARKFDMSFDAEAVQHYINIICN